MRAHEFMQEDELHAPIAQGTQTGIECDHGLWRQLEALVQALKQAHNSDDAWQTTPQPLTCVSETRERNWPTQLPPEICGDHPMEASAGGVEVDTQDEDGDVVVMVMEPAVLHANSLLRQCRQAAKRKR